MRRIFTNFMRAGESNLYYAEEVYVRFTAVFRFAMDSGPKVCFLSLHSTFRRW